jgi:hypothetical protein
VQIRCKHQLLDAADELGAAQPVGLVDVQKLRGKGGGAGRGGQGIKEGAGKEGWKGDAWCVGLVGVQPGKV